MADLQAMGIRQLFDRDSAELQGIADVPKPFYLTTIVHSARIKVDEKVSRPSRRPGRSLGAAPPCPWISSRTGRFLVVLAESSSHAPLFLAIVRDPRTAEE